MSSLLGSHSYLSLFIYISSLTFLFQSFMQVNDTGGPLALDTLPPMPSMTSPAPAVRAIPIPHFPASFFFRSSLSFSDSYLLPQSVSAPPSITGSNGSLAKKGTFFFLFSFLLFLTCLFIACTVFHATQDFYKQDIHTQNFTLCSCSLSAIEVALIFVLSNILQAIYSLENAARNYKDATEEQNCLSSLYDFCLSARSARQSASLSIITSIYSLLNCILAIIPNQIVSLLILLYDCLCLTQQQTLLSSFLRHLATL